jgi:cell shape-determining protein MreC
MKILQRFSRRWLLAILVCGSIATALGGHTGLGQALGSRMRGLAGIVLAPFARAGTYAVTEMRRQLHTGDNRLEDENRQLREILALTQAQLAQQLGRNTTSDHLYSELHDFNCKLINASVLAYPSLPYAQTRTIGSAAGELPLGTRITTRELLTDCQKALPKGLATISTTALVGEIDESGAFMSRLRLVTDADFKIGACILRILQPGQVRKFLDTKDTTGAAAFKNLTGNEDPVPVVATGDGVRGLTVTISKNHGIAAGDLLVTTKSDTFLPYGVRIGHVEEVRDNPKEPGQVILTIRPEADLSALSDVYIVVPPSIKQSPGKDAPN